MTGVRHLNGGRLHAPPNPPAACHCLLLAGDDGLTLVDAGIGLADCAAPEERVGRFLIDVGGFLFDPADALATQLPTLGLAPADVKHIVLTHADPDHAGGLADFPHAAVHISQEELAAVRTGEHFRYRAPQFAHDPRWVPHEPSDQRWFGLECRPVDVGPGLDVRLVWLPGHTPGHCGVAVRQGDRWLLHVGDAYFLRVELDTDDHPVSALTTQRAMDDAGRRASLAELRRLHRDHAGEITMLGYHDFTEFPPG